MKLGEFFGIETGVWEEGVVATQYLRGEQSEWPGAPEVEMRLARLRHYLDSLPARLARELCLQTVFSEELKLITECDRGVF